MFARSALRTALGVLIVLVIAAGILALGWTVYNAGVAQGAAQSGASVAPQGAGPGIAPFYGSGPYFFHPHGFGFGFLGCLVPLFVVFLGFALLRMVMWGPWMGPGHFGPGMHGRFRGEGWRGRWGEMAEEWHRQAHARGSTGPSAGAEEGDEPSA